MKQFTPTCSFCGVSQSETRRVVAGPGESYICDKCVEICTAMLLGDTGVEQSDFALDAEGSVSCSFCGEKSGDVWKLLIGEKRNVCSECLGVCNDIFGDMDAGNRTARERAAELRSLNGTPPPSVSATLSGYVVSAPDSFLGKLLMRLRS